MSYLNNKSILITGGTGSFGKKFIETALSKFKPKKSTLDAKAKAEAAEAEAKKAEVKAKKEERESKDAKKDLEDAKSKAESGEAINTFRVRALGLDWSRKELIKEAETLFSNVA